MINAFALFMSILWQTPSAVAVVNGAPVLFDASSDIETIRMATVRIVRASNEGFVVLCSGVQMGGRQVLLADHCFKNKKGEIYDFYLQGKVYAEVRDPSSPTGIKRIQVGTMDSQQDADRDLALVALREDTPFRQSIPLAFDGCDEDSQYTVAGYGVNGTVRSQTLDTATYRKISANEAKYYQGLILDRYSHPENWLTLKKVSGSVCFGDSGSPIFCKSHGRLALVGITSTIHKSNVSSKPDQVSQSTYCQMNDVISGSLVQPNMYLIEAWRHYQSTDVEPQSDAAR
jgi:hypothetical protein